MPGTITKLVSVPSGVNVGIDSAKQATMLGLMGNPRENYDQVCREITDPKLKAQIELANVGPFRVQGFKPAVASLREILGEIAVTQPDVHASLGTMGMACARLVRGTTSNAISNHSWGTAIDLTLDGVLDTRGDNLVQEGLTRIFPAFNRHGWFWGAGFRTEDAMHFEAGDALIRKWNAGPGTSSPAATDVLISVGDRGPDVLAVQRRLNKLGARLDEDGDFGNGTRAAVMAFQGANGLRPDGVVDSRTRAALGL